MHRPDLAGQTQAHSSRRSGRPFSHLTLAGTLMGCAFIMPSCASKPQDPLVMPRVLAAPYAAASGEVTWAVVPLRNESGVATVSGEAMGDKLVAAVEEVRGVRCVPLNRTLLAMRALEMDSVRSPADARKLAEVLGVDGVLVGSITAWDPYTPVLGLSVALYARPGAALGQRPMLGPRDVSTQTTEARGPASLSDGPLALVSEHLDSKNNSILLDVQAFGEGRQNGPSALGWRRYLESMDLYSEFAAYRVVDEIIRSEWIRVGASGPSAPADGSGNPRSDPGRATQEGSRGNTMQEKPLVRVSEGAEGATSDR